MIDWLEPDLRQTEQETLNCAAGNYFVLEEKMEGGRERKKWSAGGGETETEWGGIWQAAMS